MSCLHYSAEIFNTMVMLKCHETLVVHLRSEKDSRSWSGVKIWKSGSVEGGNVEKLDQKLPSILLLEITILKKYH